MIGPESTMTDPKTSPKPDRADEPQNLYERLLAAEDKRQARAIKYEDFHRERYDYVVSLCQEVAPNRDAKVLDIGRSKLSLLISEDYDSMSTMGFPIVEDTHGIRGDQLSPQKHIVFDLNDAQYPERWVELPKFDLIVFAEVIEHIHTAPELVLAFLASGLAPGGHLICQTPNAVSLDRRLHMLFGRNPYDRILINHANPAHFREYTKRELCSFGEDVGLEVVYHEYRDYFGVNGGPVKQVVGKLFKAVCEAVPRLSRGQTVIFRRPS